MREGLEEKTGNAGKAGRKVQAVGPGSRPLSDDRTPENCPATQGLPYTRNDNCPASAEKTAAWSGSRRGLRTGPGGPVRCASAQ